MLNISNIALAKESSGKFYLNVDGIKGVTFSNVEIRPNDSIFIFVEAYIDPTDNNNPLEFKDKIKFTTNGVEQNVTITAWGQNVKREYGTLIDKDTHFTAELPYVIFDTLKVAENVTLTLDPGTILYFHDKGGMKIDGRLQAIGTQENPILFRGDRLDKVVGQISFDLMSGQWGGVNFTEKSYGNAMHYVLMCSSTTGISIDSCDISKRKLHLYNSVLHNATKSTLISKHAWIEAQGSEFSDAGDAVVSLTGGKAIFTNCTLANYYLFSAITSPILSIYYLLPSEYKELQLMDARFDNCIIYGNANDINVGDLTGSSVMFRNCLLRSSGSDDSNFINCVWKGDPKFFTVREDYIFDYRLKNESDAIAKGDNSLSPPEIQYDRYGVNRISAGAIDIGAYTWVKSEDEEK